MTIMLSLLICSLVPIATTATTSFHSGAGPFAVGNAQQQLLPRQHHHHQHRHQHHPQHHWKTDDAITNKRNDPESQDSNIALANDAKNNSTVNKNENKEWVDRAFEYVSMLNQDLNRHSSETVRKRNEAILEKQKGWCKRVVDLIVEQIDGSLTPEEVSEDGHDDHHHHSSLREENNGHQSRSSSSTRHSSTVEHDGDHRSVHVPRSYRQETDSLTEIQVELPGVSLSDIQVEIINPGRRRCQDDSGPFLPTLIVSGSSHRRRPPPPTAAGNTKSSTTTRFEKRFHLTQTSDINEVSAEFFHGLLTVTIPCSSKAATRGHNERTKRHIIRVVSDE